MILNDNFIFIHVPKTAGTSITSIWGMTQEKIYPMHTPYFYIKEKRAFSFGFVRNPWDRLLSLYSFCCQKHHGVADNFSQDHIKNIGFKRWLLEDKFLMSQDCNWPCVPMQQRDQLWWLNGVDYIGQFESLEKDMDFIFQKTNTPRTRISHIKQSNHPDYRDLYTDEMIEFVNIHHKPTIEQFNYKF